MTYILAIDQGTTSTRAVVFNRQGRVQGQHQLALKQYFPQPGWVEHDPEEIWQSVLQCCRQAIAAAGLQPRDMAALGISNQRETTIIWDKKTGQPIYPAMVWQGRHTTALCDELAKQSGITQVLRDKTGLVLDPYFSATKISWMLDHVPGARQRADNGELLFGTVDSFLLWRLSAGAVHATDASNASRTLLFNIHDQAWDDELLALFRVPRLLLPEVLDNNAHFADTAVDVLGAAIPITGMAGDQQAALIGQACVEPGMVKSTYGTGCFLLLNTGTQAVVSQHRLLTTVAYRINGAVSYGLEGSIFSAGTSIQWLRDELHFIKQASETAALAASLTDNEGVYFLPAFTGLGAPYWQPNARGAIVGLTQNTGMAHIVRAALEAVCYCTEDLMRVMAEDFSGDIQTLRVDGGMAVNDWLLQFLADMLGLPVMRSSTTETSVFGAALLAGLGAGIYQTLDDIAELWVLEREFQASMPAAKRDHYYAGWLVAIDRILR